MHACYALYTLRMRETPPTPDVFSSVFPSPWPFDAEGRAHGGDKAGACRQQQQRLKPGATNIPIQEDI
ncbi:hypothetical protein AB205_0127330 [Aquarana catesbeiana]|uniref:Uncharacterized protein n=1 Tax=Aquarana catesbeiana TaxID=8400 RepID=A0A2G9RCB6_AQUCT|nr:hypothetical protein AB205_0127330 [Aquarana catesbeiana]